MAAISLISMKAASISESGVKMAAKENNVSNVAYRNGNENVEMKINSCGINNRNGVEENGINERKISKIVMKEGSHRRNESENVKSEISMAASAAKKAAQRSVWRPRNES
jgi:hypothetical protein